MASMHDAHNDQMFGKNLSVYSSLTAPAPPPELVLEWCKQWNSLSEQGYIQQWIAIQAARWAWDQLDTSAPNEPQEVRGEPKGPTDEELIETVKQSMEDCIFLFELLYYNREPLMQILRAVLARWGNHPGSPDSSTPPS